MASIPTTGNSGGTQSTTQSPQTAGGASGGAPSNSGSVQPGTATSLLNTDKGGISLNNQSLSLVNLGERKGQVSQFTPTQTSHKSPVLYGVSGFFFVVAVILFIVTARTAKNTTD